MKEITSIDFNNVVGGCSCVCKFDDDILPASVSLGDVDDIFHCYDGCSRYITAYKDGTGLFLTPVCFPECS